MKQTWEMNISDRNSSHILRIAHDLANAGWVPSRFPSRARLATNRQLIALSTPHRTIRIRISAYKIGDRSESHRLDERRIEITTTYSSGLPRLRNWADIVLGYDFANDAYVGLDPRRLNLGGKTHNASSYVDPAALETASKSHILVRPHETTSLGLEYQAIFRPQRLGEYLFNHESIHDGRYFGDGLFSGPIRRSGGRGKWSLPDASCHGTQLDLSHGHPVTAKKRSIPTAIVRAYEIDSTDTPADLSPEELEIIRRRCQEIGDSGEHYVYRYERQRLHKSGRSDLAGKVDWVSQRATGRGYDIKSFETNGSPRLIEVKATITNGKTFLMSGKEWKIATRMRASYWIYRVVRALDDPRISAQLNDPIGAEETSIITRLPDGWRVTIL